MLSKEMSGGDKQRKELYYAATVKPFNPVSGTGISFRIK
jgi:hypothetical protein